MSQGKITIRSAVVVLIVLVALLQLSFWADHRSFEVEGPSRMVRGPQDTIYIQIDRKIARISSEGEVLQVLDLDADAAIPEHIADFFVEDDGRLLIARRDSQLLQYYSQEGTLIKTHLRVPSELVEGKHFCKFSKDAATGMLYFADTSHHRIQIFGPDEKELKTILVPSGSQKAIGQEEGEEEEAEGVVVASPDSPLHYPNGLLFDRDRLIATDTGNSRIISFYPDGSLDKVISSLDVGSPAFDNPIRVSRAGDTIYVIVRGPNFLGGRVAAFDLKGGQQRKFLRQRILDPWDVFSRADDVLIADRESLSVLRYTHDGRLLGAFGAASLRSLYAERQVVRKTYQWLRFASLGSMLLVLGWLLFASRRQRIAHDLAGAGLYKPVMGLQNFLGPMGSVRRNAFLVLIPVLGQAAAGRIMRTVTLSLLLLFFVSLVVYSWMQYRISEAVSLPVLITVMLMTYTVWTIITLDGVRLSGGPSVASRGLRIKHFFVAVAAALITVCAATAVQLVREFIIRIDPGFSLRIQAVIQSLMTIFSKGVSPFFAMLPAAVVFGWGGATAGMFGALSWQARAGRSKILIGTALGFLAGSLSWILSTLLIGNRLGVLLYIAPVHGALLGLFAWLYFRSNGMPLLVIPVAAAGAWAGDFLKIFANVVDNAVVSILLSRGADSIWIGAVYRIELIVLPAFFIHLAVWAAWNAVAVRPVGTQDVDVDGSFARGVS